MALEIEHDGDSSLTLDDRFFPILITRWSGKPTLALAETYFRWHDLMLDRAAFEETKVVHVTDANGAKQPEASVRKFLADSAAARSNVADLALRSYVTLESKLVRGVLTVIGWVMGEAKSKPVMTASLEEALTQALGDLDASKIARPRGLDPQAYQRGLGLSVAS